MSKTKSLFSFTKIVGCVILLSIIQAKENLYATETYGIEYLNLLNNSFSKIEKHLQDRNRKELCIELKKSRQNINSNMTTLEELEPYYQWGEIKDLITQMEKKSCK